MTDCRRSQIQTGAAASLCGCLSAPYLQPVDVLSHTHIKSGEHKRSDGGHQEERQFNDLFNHPPAVTQARVTTHHQRRTAHLCELPSHYRESTDSTGERDLTRSAAFTQTHMQEHQKNSWLSALWENVVFCPQEEC